MHKVVVLVVILCVIGEVYGHAALAKPIPWWWAPSRDRPCGGANYTAKVQAIWPVGSNQSVQWWVVAGDGMGEVHARIDTGGGTNNFTDGVPVGFAQPVFKSLGFYWISFIVPNIACHGFNKTCTMQFWTDSGGGWYSCTTIQVVCTGCQGGIPVSRDDCVTAGDLTFCSKKDNTQVLVPDGQTAQQIDTLTQKTFNLNHPNPNVFSNGNSSACLPLYQDMLCELYLAPCGNSSSKYTEQQCQNVLKTCGITDLHKDLYNCSVFPSDGTIQHPFFALVLLLLLAFVL